MINHDTGWDPVPHANSRIESSPAVPGSTAKTMRSFAGRPDPAPEMASGIPASGSSSGDGHISPSALLGRPAVQGVFGAFGFSLWCAPPQPCRVTDPGAAHRDPSLNVREIALMLRARRGGIARPECTPRRRHLGHAGGAGGHAVQLHAEIRASARNLARRVARISVIGAGDLHAMAQYGWQFTREGRNDRQRQISGHGFRESPTARAFPAWPPDTRLNGRPAGVGHGVSATTLIRSTLTLVCPHRPAAVAQMLDGPAPARRVVVILARDCAPHASSGSGRGGRRSPPRTPQNFQNFTLIQLTVLAVRGPSCEA